MVVEPGREHVKFAGRPALQAGVQLVGLGHEWTHPVRDRMVRIADVDLVIVYRRVVALRGAPDTPGQFLELFPVLERRRGVVVHDHSFSRSNERQQGLFGGRTPAWNIELLVRVVEDDDVVGRERFQIPVAKFLGDANFESAGLGENLAEVRSGLAPRVLILTGDDEHLNLTGSRPCLRGQCQHGGQGQRGN